MDHCGAHFRLFCEASVVQLHSEICAPRFESSIDSVRVACDMSLKSEASIYERTSKEKLYVAQEIKTPAGCCRKQSYAITYSYFNRVILSKVTAIFVLKVTAILESYEI